MEMAVLVHRQCQCPWTKMMQKKMARHNEEGWMIGEDRWCGIVVLRWWAMDSRSWCEWRVGPSFELALGTNNRYDEGEVV